MVAALVSVVAMDGRSGTCDLAFADYLNAPMSGFVVPLFLEEGQGGFTYDGFASGGADLCVSDVAGGSVVTASLPYEIERWLPGGKSIVWVRVPTFSSTTVLRLSWGADQIASPTTTGVWSDSWAAFHMNAATGKEEGPLGDAAVLGSQVYSFACPSDSVAYSKAFTISFWFKAKTPVTKGYVSKLQNSRGGQFAVIYNFTEGKMELYRNASAATGTDPRDYSGMDVPDCEWHHYAYSYDGTTLKCYRDGALQLSNNLNFSLITDNAAGTIFVGGSSAGRDMPSGSVDEYRMTVKALSQAEIQAMCEVESAKFFDVGMDVAFPEFSGSAPLKDFLALVTLNDRVAGFDAQTVEAALANGSFGVRLAGTNERLPVEREMVTLGNGSSEMSFWVMIPSLDANTRLRLSWLKTGCSGRAAISFPERNAAAWPTESFLAWHFAHCDANGARSEAVNDGGTFVVSGARRQAPMDGPTGRYAAMRTAVGTDSKLDLSKVGTTGKSLGKVYTISFWARRDDFDNPGNGYLFCMEKSGVQRAVIAGFGEGNSIRLYGNGYAYGNATLSIPDADWHHYAFVADGNSLSGYCDGVCQFSGGSVLDFSVGELAQWDVYVGSSRNANDAFTGGLDEFRIDAAARSADWIRTSYRNQLAYRHGQTCLNAPGFVFEESESLSADSISFSTRLNSRQSSSVTFFYGTADGGCDADAWEHQIDLGTIDGDATVGKVVQQLPFGTALHGRFRGSNAAGIVWSRPIFGRAKTSGSTYGAKVTLSGYTGSSALEGFPVCVRLPASQLLPESAANVWVETKKGVAIPFEVEAWDRTGVSVLWVRLPRVSKGGSFYVRWGEGAQPVIWPKSAVWDDAYVRVYHMGAEGADSSASEADVTSVGCSSDAAGLAGRCRQFSGASGAMMTRARPFVEFGDGFTLSLCAKFNATTSQYVWQSNTKQQLATIFGFNGESVEIYAQETPGTYTDLVRGMTLLPTSAGTWHHIAYSYDGKILRSYCDGSLVKEEAISYALGGIAPEARGCPVAIGGEITGRNTVNGLLDEFRVERVGRSSDWIGACSANMADTLCTVGPYETVQLPLGMALLFR